MRTFFGSLTGNVEDGKIKKANVTFLEHDILSTPPAESNSFGIVSINHVLEYINGMQ